MTTTHEFEARTEPHDGLTAALRLTAPEHIRIGRHGATWRAYWTLPRTSYAPTHGGATSHLRWRAVRDWTGALVTGDTVEALAAAITTLHTTSDLEVPMFEDAA